MMAAGLAACSPAGAALGVGASVATASLEERGLEGFTDDASIQMTINRLWLEHDPDMFLAANMMVREGRVLLTGEVTRPEDRVAAARLAWQVDGVRAVINELRVEESASLVDATADGAVARKLKARLLFDQKVQSINYSVDVVNGTVYLMGVAQSQETLDRVLGYAYDTRGVRRVVSYVRLKEDRALGPEHDRPLL